MNNSILGPFDKKKRIVKKIVVAFPNSLIGLGQISLNDHLSTFHLNVTSQVGDQLWQEILKILVASRHQMGPRSESYHWW